MRDGTGGEGVNGVATASANEKAAHTPGPWTATFGAESGYDCMFGAWSIVAKGEQRVADVDQGSYGQTACDHEFRSAGAEANARLIAAAPELLAACRAFIEKWALVLPAINNASLMQHIHGQPYNGPTVGGEIEQIRDAIAKAEGR